MVTFGEHEKLLLESDRDIFEDKNRWIPWNQNSQHITRDSNLVHTEALPFQ